MKKFFIAIGMLCLVAGACVFAPAGDVAHAQPADAYLGLEPLIERYLQGLEATLPPAERGEIEAYREYFKSYIRSSVNSVLPVETLERQLKAAEELFPLPPEPEAGAPGAANLRRSDQSLLLAAEPVSPLPKRPVVVSASFVIGDSFQVADSQKGATASYQWYLDTNPVPVQSGVGKNTLSFVSGPLGTIHSVRLQVRAGGKVSTAAMLIPVVDADLVWYTDTYTPPGYRGKSLASDISPIAVVAQVFVPKSFGLLDYVWTVDADTPLTGYGIGKNQVFLGFPQSIHTVEVRITDLSGNIDITKTVTITRVEPEVRLHRLRSNRADYEIAPRDAFETAPGGKFSVIAFPYYFTVHSLNGLRFSWSFDTGTLPEAPKNPDLFTLNIAQASIPAGTRFTKDLQVLVESKNPRQEESLRVIVPVTIR